MQDIIIYFLPVGFRTQHFISTYLQIKTESGAKTKTNKTGIYKKWKERSHSKISLKGTSADGDAQESTSSRGNILNELLPLI
jgi:phage gp29-like protein